jgi:hypothetical protein
LTSLSFRADSTRSPLAWPTSTLIGTIQVALLVAQGITQSGPPDSGAQRCL